MTGATMSRMRSDWRVGRARAVAWYKHRAVMLNLSALLGIFVLIVTWDWITVVVPAGHVGIMWYRFAGGTDTLSVYGEGNHFLWPWDKMAQYDARLQQASRDFEVLSRDGMTVNVNVSFRYRLNESQVGDLHKRVGPNYVETLLVPTVGSYARIVFSQNSNDEIYTNRRTAIQSEIKRAVAAELESQAAAKGGPGHAPWLTLDDLLVRGMSFPPEVQAAINRKMEQQQLREEFAYRLQREELESRRKEVEANGIARFQSIVGAGISETYLRWKGIDATLALAQSSNAKVVVIGAGKDGMPLILGGVDQPVPAPRPPGDAAPADSAPRAEVPLSTLPAAAEKTGSAPAPSSAVSSATVR